MSDLCGVCGGDIEPWAAEMRDIYSIHGITKICESCADECNRYVNYFGPKKEDKASVFRVLNDGVFAQKKLSQLMNAGYF